MLTNISAVIYLLVPILGALMTARSCFSPTPLDRFWSRMTAVAVILTTAAFLLPSLALLHLLMFLIVPVTARRNPADIMPIYLFSLVLLPDLATTLELGGTRLWVYNIDQSLGLGALVALMAAGRRMRGSLAAHLPFLFLFGVMLVTTVRDTSFTNFLRESLQAILVVALPYAVTILGVRTQQDIRNIMFALAAAGTVLAATMIVETALAWPVYRQLYAHYGLDLTQNVHLRGGMLRAAGSFMEATHAALFIVSCFFAAWLARDQFKTRMHHLFFVGLIAAGLLMPQSRGAFLGVALGFLLIDLFRKKYGALGRNVAILAAAGAILFAVGQVNDRVGSMLGLTEEGMSTVDYRQRLWDRGMEEIAAHPLAGRPYPQVKMAMEDMTQGENIVDFVNTYLFFALTGGLIGLLFFAGGLVMSVAAAWRKRERAPGTVGAFVFVGLTSPIVMIAFTFLSGRSAILLISMMALVAILPRKAPERVHLAPKPRRPRVATLDPGHIDMPAGISLRNPSIP